MNDSILLDSSAVDCALSHNLKACLRKQFFNGNDIRVHGHAWVIPRDQATVYSSCGKSRESNVLNVNPGCTLCTDNQCKASKQAL